MSFTRLIVWIVLLAIVLAGRFLWDVSVTSTEPELDPSAVVLPGGWIEREASVEEWLSDISALGISGAGKRLVWLPVALREAPPRGTVVWWHDGREERLGYIPAEGEDGTIVMFTFVRGLTSGQIALYDVHNDPELADRILNQINANWAVPEQLLVLRAPKNTK